MLRDVGFEVDTAPTWVPTDWRAVDRALRTIAKRRAGLDAEEARWLREAEKLQIWRPLGMVSVLDYLERVFGYSPRVAQERLRVARALDALPGLAGALGSGAMPFSAVRELTRVVTPATEGAWLAAAADMNLRQIEDLVAGHRPGDRPDDPADPEARTHVVRFELSAVAYAQLRQARSVLDEAHGNYLSDDELVAALADAVLDGTPAAESDGRAKFQIAVTVCERCKRGWQHGAGATLAIEPAAVDRAMCDAQHIGSLDGDAPARAYQDIAPSTSRLVWRRDGGRCRVPGCRSARGLEIHHVVHRADGGGHEAANLVLLCSACHMAHHRGALAISGNADQLTIMRPELRSEGNPHVGAPSQQEREPRPHVDALSQQEREPRPRAGALNAMAVPAPPSADAASRLGAAVLRTQSKQALVGLGWKPAVAAAAVTEALGALGPAAPLDRLIFEALRRCPRSAA